MTPQPGSPSEEQASYFADQLDRWADQLEVELSGRVALPTSVQHAKRQELYDIHRQIKALRDRFPGAFDDDRR
jgi:type VI protein secretion system component VasK